ncbi:MAG: class I SAM-dependent methyltransferase [Planctomycetota bacterium]
MAKEKNIQKFNQDIEENEGYYYTQTSKLSCRLANQRLSRAVAEMTCLSAKRVLDIGCGDGTYTIELLNKGPKYVLGVDAAQAAVDLARKKVIDFDNIEFRVLDIYELANLQEKFDVAIVRGVLHHLYDIRKAIVGISKVAGEVIVIEPNGYSPILKIIEKTSRYHIKHEEKSYSPHRLNKWFSRIGGELIQASYCNIVPFFCWDILARMLKTIEPFIERTFLLKQLFCAVYVMKVHFGRNENR